MKRARGLNGIALLIALVPACRAQQFPQWRVGLPLGLEGNWQTADTVLFGRLTHVVQVGSQEVANLPWPAPQSLHEIYWCQADFQPLAPVKGLVPPSRAKVLWAVIRPDCTFLLKYDSERTTETSPVTRVWFFRAEGEYLRPVVDFGLFSVAFNWQWRDTPREAVPRLFASLLFDRALRDSDPNRYDGSILDAAEVARTILPKEELIARLKALARTDQRVHESICGWLQVEYREACE